MSTDFMLYPGATLTLGVDGWRPVGIVADDGCCADGLCLPFCDVACGFVDLLPSGPMWDRAKDEARRNLAQGGDYDPCNPVCFTDPTCTTMVDYGIYGARVLSDMVSNILWPVIRESSPETAFSTIDDWLNRYGWQDCYRQHCRSFYTGTAGPYEYENDCGEFVFCPPAFPSDFECALKHAILISLSRAQRGFIKNIDGLNWIIAPLGAMLRPLEPFPIDVQEYQDNSCDLGEDGPPCFCAEVMLEMINISDTLPRCPQSQCGDDPGFVSASQSYICNGVETNIYPGQIAAECIVRSILPRCPSKLVVDPSPPAPPPPLP